MIMVRMMFRIIEKEGSWIFHIQPQRVRAVTSRLLAPMPARAPRDSGESGPRTVGQSVFIPAERGGLLA